MSESMLPIICTTHTIFTSFKGQKNSISSNLNMKKSECTCGSPRRGPWSTLAPNLVVERFHFSFCLWLITSYDYYLDWNLGQVRSTSHTNTCYSIVKGSCQKINMHSREDERGDMAPHTLFSHALHIFKQGTQMAFKNNIDKEEKWDNMPWNPVSQW